MTEGAVEIGSLDPGLETGGCCEVGRRLVGGGAFGSLDETIASATAPINLARMAGGVGLCFGAGGTSSCLVCNGG